jgi:N-formylglutamate deformylase
MSHYVFNIPHASTNIPFKEGFIGDLYKKEVALLTDHATDIIFNVPGVQKMVAPFSRVFCDVERFPDSREEMEKYGMGVFYTHTDDGQLMRVLLDEKKKYSLEPIITTITPSLRR